MINTTILNDPKIYLILLTQSIMHNSYTQASNSHTSIPHHHYPPLPVEAEFTGLRPSDWLFGSVSQGVSRACRARGAGASRARGAGASRARGSGDLLPLIHRSLQDAVALWVEGYPPAIRE